MVAWESLDALSHQLELCKIDDAIRVAIVLDSDTATEHADLMRVAVARTGADAIEVRLVHRTATSSTSMLQGVMDTADVALVVGDQAEAAVLALDTSTCDVLLYGKNPAPAAFPPHANLASRVATLHNRVGEASTIALIDDHGTNLEINLEASTHDFDHGFAGEGASVATFPAGWVGTTPAKGAVQGEIVLMPGDANLAIGQLLRSPVRLEIIDDHISTIGGESADADVIRALLEEPELGSAYGIAGFTIGLNPPRTPLALLDDRLCDPHIARLLAGVVTLSFGDNLLADRPCPQTITFALRRRSLHIDNLPAITKGELQGHYAPDVYEL